MSRVSSVISKFLNTARYLFFFILFSFRILNSLSNLLQCGFGVFGDTASGLKIPRLFLAILFDIISVEIPVCPVFDPEAQTRRVSFVSLKDCLERNKRIDSTKDGNLIVITHPVMHHTVHDTSSCAEASEDYICRSLGVGRPLFRGDYIIQNDR